MDSWVLKAIEREAMARAQSDLARMPQTFTYMGVNVDQIAWLIRDYEARTAQRADQITP